MVPRRDIVDSLRYGLAVHEYLRESPLGKLIEDNLYSGPTTTNWPIRPKVNYEEKYIRKADKPFMLDLVGIDIRKETEWLKGYAYAKTMESPLTFAIKKVIFNNPATIVYWMDGTKTVVKRQKGDRWNQEKGLAMCFMKKALGNKGNFNDIVKKFCKE